MFYIAIERQATTEIRFSNNKTVITHALLLNYLPNGEGFIPLFLSRLHAYIYLKPTGLLKEFKLVPTNSIELGIYQDICQSEQETGQTLFPHTCRMIFGVTKDRNKKSCLLYYSKAYPLSVAFFSEEDTRKELRSQLGKAYDLAVDSDDGSETKITQQGDKLIKKMKLVISDSENRHLSDNAPLPENIGKMYGFVLVDKNWTMYAVPGQPTQCVLAFV